MQPQLSFEMKHKARAFLENASSSAVCDYCQNDTWEMGEEFLITETISQTGIAYPYIVLVCNKCTNTKFFNAVAMGILET